jgi:hypothetical protein
MSRIGAGAVGISCQCFVLHRESFYSNWIATGRHDPSTPPRPCSLLHTVEKGAKGLSSPP